MGEDVKTAVKHVADLARLETSAGNFQKYTERASKIIEYFHKLNELDTSQVEPTAHALAASSPLREDEVVEFKPVDKIMNQTPETDGPFMQVPKVI